MSSCRPEEVFGADPAYIRWQVVRGDSASIKIEFFENDEVTPYDISQWAFRGTAYDPADDALDLLTITKGTGFITVSASSAVTENWGTTFRSIVNELLFDIEATLLDGTKWTPVIGVITVLGDVTRGNL